MGSFALSCVAYHEKANSAQTFLSAAQQMSNTHTTGQQNLTAVATQSNSLNCYQSSGVSLYAGGQYAPDGWSLSSYNLTATTSLTATQGQSSGGSSTAAGLNTAGQSFTSSGNSSQAQATFQSQSGTVTEQGTYGGGGYALSLVSFTEQGAQSCNSTTNNDTYTGAKSGHDASAATASGQGSYTATGLGSWVKRKKRDQSRLPPQK